LYRIRIGFVAVVVALWTKLKRKWLLEFSRGFSHVKKAVSDYVPLALTIIEYDLSP
jgi:hypothetical protein